MSPNGLGVTPHFGALQTLQNYDRQLPILLKTQLHKKQQRETKKERKTKKTKEKNVLQNQ